MIRRLLIIGTLLASAHPTHAETWDHCVRRLCTSTHQQNCWLKAGTAMCDKDQMECKELPGMGNPFRVIRKESNRWLVQTRHGKGWVSERMVMLDDCET